MALKTNVKLQIERKKTLGGTSCIWWFDVWSKISSYQIKLNPLIETITDNQFIYSDRTTDPDENHWFRRINV